MVGPHGGPVISEGVQILQHYSELIGLGGPNTSKYLDRGELFQGGPFFRDRALAWRLITSLSMVVGSVGTCSVCPSSQE